MKFIVQQLAFLALLLQGQIGPSHGFLHSSAVGSAFGRSATLGLRLQTIALYAPSSSRVYASEQGDRETTDADTSSKTSSPSSTTAGGLDTGAIVKYVAAIGIQMGLVAALFQVLDRIVTPTVKIPLAVNAVGMYVLALKSRVFNPLSNRRPQPSTQEIQGNTLKRKMPTWTPPGVVFPIVWLLLIGPLRAVTSAMIIRASGGKYTTPALLSLVLHLSIGDVWNTINNVEQRYGTSVLGVLCVWLSAAFAAYQYSQVLPLAGKLLALKLIWLTVATSLITRTWQLNPKDDGTLSPIWPTKGDGKAETRFEWFSGDSSKK